MEDNFSLTYRVFDFVAEPDCFTTNPTYEGIVRQLGLTEWHAAVWIGRYFCLDNDVGEHWFDNWELRAERAALIAQLGCDETDLLIIDPRRMQDGRDGPCHPPELRKLFWRDVLCSLRVSQELLVAQARFHKLRLESRGLQDEEAYIIDIEARIEDLFGPR